MKRPKRPLTAYNLFFRFKREKILGAHKRADDSADSINRLIEATPGLEEQPDYVKTMSPKEANERRRNDIREAMKENISPKDNRHRSHRKTHGALSFLEMNKKMVNSWKSIDGFTRSVFEELAEEGRMLYRKRIAEYEEEHPSPPKKKARSPSSIAKLNAPSKKQLGTKTTATPERAVAASKQGQVMNSDTPKPSRKQSIPMPVTPPTPQMTSHSKIRNGGSGRSPVENNNMSSVSTSRKAFPTIPSFCREYSSPGNNTFQEQKQCDDLSWDNNKSMYRACDPNDPRFFYHSSSSRNHGQYNSYPHHQVPRRASEHTHVSLSQRIDSLTHESMMPLPVFSDVFSGANNRSSPSSLRGGDPFAMMDPFPDIYDVPPPTHPLLEEDASSFDDFFHMPFCDVDQQSQSEYRKMVGEPTVEDFMGLLSTHDGEEKGHELFDEVDDFMENKISDHGNLVKGR